jgi:hypothetical protein
LIMALSTCVIASGLVGLILQQFHPAADDPARAASKPSTVRSEHVVGGLRGGLPTR